jgi:hypothetical protein
MREKRSATLSWTILLALTLQRSTFAQGNFLYDQQSANESTGGGASGDIQSNQPIGQSFSPSLSAVGFIRLFMYDFHPGDGLGATVSVNLRSSSMSGTVIAQSAPVSMINGFSGFPDFIFSTAAPVTPGTTYYFQPVVQSGGSPDWAIVVYNYGYSGGMEFLQGQPIPPNDLWFREGIIVPEPSTVCLALLGGAGFVYARSRKMRC